MSPLTTICDHGAAPGACAVTGCEHSRAQTRCAQRNCQRVPTGAHDERGRWYCAEHVRPIHLAHLPEKAEIARKGAGMMANPRGVNEDGIRPPGAVDWAYRPPVRTPDEHHELPLVINHTLAWQQAPPVHIGNAYQPVVEHRPRLGPSEEEAAIAYLAGIDALNARERTILAHRTAGYSASEIAKRLHLSLRQIRRAIERSLGKLRTLSSGQCSP